MRAYCNNVCPTQSNPRELLREITINTINSYLSIGKPSREREIESYHLIELAKMAIGKKPPY